ncbi:hypothetical protein Fcan01_02565 [Folsomia candida]|uniref:Uncharacterized protein n=1 Tax=Folsomia candida TaxID=158441 RepID=A0A226EXG2_FOLCA|nr:hypothetical protein Fcan01_02565 [Folsomia candida]
MISMSLFRRFCIVRFRMSEGSGHHKSELLKKQTEQIFHVEEAPSFHAIKTPTSSQKSIPSFDVTSKSSASPNSLLNTRWTNSATHNSQLMRVGKLASELGEESAFSLGLPPIKRKKFPYYPYGLILPKCKPINGVPKKHGKTGKQLVEPWTDALKDFYQTVKALENGSNEKSELQSSPTSTQSVGPNEIQKPRIRKTRTQAESTMKFKMTEIQHLFATEMKELQDTYQKLKIEPDPKAEAALEESWKAKKIQLQKQIDQCIDEILESIKAIYF